MFETHPITGDWIGDSDEDDEYVRVAGNDDTKEGSRFILAKRMNEQGI